MTSLPYNYRGGEGREVWWWWGYKYDCAFVTCRLGIEGMGFFICIMTDGKSHPLHFCHTIETRPILSFWNPFSFCPPSSFLLRQSQTLNLNLDPQRQLPNLDTAPRGANAHPILPNLQAGKPTFILSIHLLEISLHVD